MYHQIAVLGAGTMGSGLAQLFARCGMPIVLYDPDRKALDRAREAIGRSAELHIRDWPNEQKAWERAADKIRMTEDLKEAVQGADFVLEAGPENIGIKRDIYKAVAPFLGDDALVASNTSSLALDTLVQGQPFGDRFVIAHFFNPAHLVPLVEIVKRPDTRPDLTDRLIGVLVQCGKAPVILKKDCPGFIANRLQAAVLREACHLLQSGVADAEQIDRAMKEGPGLRWAINGPFEIADFGGLDIWERVTGNLFPSLDNGLTPPEPVRDNVSNGKLGVKTGSGFYEYGDGLGRENVIEHRDRNFMQLIRLKKELKTT
ncbi:MAG: 3-hydroxybutyryl-CoA dehydrogenase [Paenibacillus sp.]|nr:3-hydroxybutyryl-CoA dehydrogenase [Paenibacillus sp.]